MLQGEVSTNQRISGTVSSSINIEGVVFSGIRIINQGYNKEEIDAKVNAKQDKLSVSQLANINADHSKYLTSHQSLSAYALKSELFSKSYNDLTNKPNIPIVPTKISAFTNDVGYLTQHQNLNAYALKSELPDVSNLQTKLVAGDNITITNNVISASGGGSGDVTKSYVDTELAKKQDKGNYALKSELFSGSYNDLTNKPTIPSISGLASEVYVTNAIKDKADKSEIITSYNDLSDKPALFDGNYNSLTNKPTIPTIPTKVSAFTNDVGYLTSHQDISGKADTSSLSTVATSGSYNDLSDKPTIPASVTDAHINSLIDAKLGVIENGSY